MPTFKHAPFIPRALASLQAQSFQDWELIIIDDGSPDETGTVVQRYLDDPRIRYHRLPKNRGVGSALNIATALARGRYLAYLPSDDMYFPDHLASLVQCLDARPEVYLAYSGVRWGDRRPTPTLQGDSPVGREADALASVPIPTSATPLPSGNILAVVQVMHRRTLEQVIHWTPREQMVSDTLEADYWRAILQHNQTFAYSGQTTCLWSEHPDQHHIITGGNGSSRARYRNYYGVEHGVWLNWQPSLGMCVDERERYGRFAVARDLPQQDGLRILLVGSLGFNEERIMAFEEQGHKLYGLWLQDPQVWDGTGPFAYGNVDQIPYAEDWRARVKQLNPDVIYAGINWQSLWFLHEVLLADLGIPFVFHFKEGPQLLDKVGLWSKFVELLERSDGLIFINEESRAWIQLTADLALDHAKTFILDADLPKRDWFNDDWPAKRSLIDGEIHTVCAGRPLGLDPFEDIAAAGIHVHFYGRHFQQWFPNWSRNSAATGYMHLHPNVEHADWVREMGQYDAAWFHVFDSYNEGDLRRATWDDLNYPARQTTTAAAGLPWILKDNRAHRVAMQQLAVELDVGIFFKTYADLARQLRDRSRLDQLTANMRTARHLFAFDTHVPELVAFFRRIIERSKSRE